MAANMKPADLAELRRLDIAHHLPTAVCLCDPLGRQCLHPYLLPLR